MLKKNLKVKIKAHLTGPAETFSNRVMKIICDGRILLPVIGIGLFMHLLKSKGGQISTVPMAQIYSAGPNLNNLKLLRS